MALAEATVKIVPDFSGFAEQTKQGVQKALDGIDKAVDSTADNIEKEFKDAGNAAEKAAKGVGDEFKKLGSIIGGAALTKAVTSFAKSAINEASNLNESVNAVQVSFGELSDQLFEFGKTAAEAVGLSRSEFNTFAVRFSGFTKVLATETKSAADFTIELTKRIADFASVNNLALEEAALVFGSTLAGETEPIRRFGKDMSAAAIEAYALASGLIASKDEMTAAIKVQATYAKLMEDTNEVAGDFVNTSDGFANRQRVLTANFKDMQGELGQALIPAMEGLLAVIGPIITGISKLPAEFRNVAAVIGLSTLATVGITKSLVGLAQTAGLSTRAISNLRAGMGLLNVAMIAFALYQQDQANNAQTLTKTLKFLTTATDEQVEAQKRNIQVMLDLSGQNPEEVFRRMAEETLGSAMRLAEAGLAQELFGISTSEATAIIDEQIAAQQQAAEDAAAAAEAIEDTGTAADTAADELRTYVKGLGFVVSESGEVEMSQENMARAVELAQDRFDAAVDAVNDYEDALSDAFDAARSSIDTGFALVESQLEATTAVKEYEKAVKKGSGSQADLDKLARETAQTLLDVADNTVANAEALAAMNGESITTAKRQELMVTELEKFRDTLNPNSPLTQYLNGMIQTLGGIPTEIPVELLAEVDAAQTELDLFKDAAVEIGRQITVGILEALAPLSPGFKKILDDMRREAGKDIDVNVRLNVTSNGDYITTPYGAMPILQTKPAPAPTKTGTLADIDFTDPFWSGVGFADGGIFNQPQIGLFAEAGAEAIIPLTRPARALELMRDSGLLGLAQQETSPGQNFDITVVSAEPMRTAKDVVREFQALEYRMAPL